MNGMVLGAFALVGVFEVGVVGSQDWREFRGSTGQGISTATNVPVRWSAAENVAWRAGIPGGGWSSPVVANGKVFLTTAVVEGEVSLRALRVNGESGRTEWSKEIFKPGAGATRELHRKNSLASPTAIVAGDRVYAHFGHMGTAALDLEGNVVWRQSSIKYSPVHGGGGSPLLVNDTLVFSCDGASDSFLAALDAKTGEIKWKSPRKTHAQRTFSFSTPLAITNGGEIQVISPTSGFVGAYEPGSGTELWRVRYGEGYSVVPRPVFAHGLLFVSSGFDRPVAHAIDPRGARADATESNLKWTISRGAPNTPSMIVVGDELYFVSDSGIASCADARTGAVHWSERIGGNYSASPVAAEGRIYFLNEAGVTTVLRASKKFEPLAMNDLGERTLASPAVVDGAIFLRTEGQLWKIRAVPD